MRKTNKAALARELEKQVLPAETIPEPSDTIIDGMSLVQKIHPTRRSQESQNRFGLRYVPRRLDQ